jgi:hypothetical protein
MFGFSNPFDFSGFGSGITGQAEYTPDFGLASQEYQPPTPMPEQIADFMSTQGISPMEFLKNPSAAFDKIGGASPMGFMSMMGKPQGFLGALLGGPDTRPVTPTPVPTTSYTQQPPGPQTSLPPPQEVPSVPAQAAPGTPGQPATPQTTQAATSQAAGSDAEAKKKEKSSAEKIVEGLKGVAALKPPEPQKVITPNPVNPSHPAAIKGGNIAALLQLLGQQQPQQQLGTKIPLSLGAVLGR